MLERARALDAADTIAHLIRHGFAYCGMRFISTDVVRENNQTYRLTYKELKPLIIHKKIFLIKILKT